MTGLLPLVLRPRILTVTFLAHDGTVKSMNVCPAAATGVPRTGPKRESPARFSMLSTFSLLIYTTVNVDPDVTVNVTPVLIVIGPATIAFFPLVMA